MTDYTNMSAARAVTEHLRTLKDGTRFTTQYMVRTTKKGNGAVSNQLYRLENLGALSQLSPKGTYIVHAIKLANYAATKTWKAKYAPRGTGYKATGKKRGPYKPRQKKLEPAALRVPIDTSDTQVLGNLLDALAKAEPVIRKYQGLAEAFAKIGV